MATAELTDIASVRQFMQKSLSDKLQDEDLEILIRQVSEAVQRHCNREFTRSQAETRSFEFLPNGNGLELVDLKPYEYRVIHSVTLDPDLTPVALVASQYRLSPYPSRDGSFYGLRLANLPEPVVPSPLPKAPLLPYQTRRLDINADWGLANTPSEVQHWTNVAVEAWAHLRREGTNPNEALMGESPLPMGYDLPLPVRWGLRRWVRPTPMA